MHRHAVKAATLLLPMLQRADPLDIMLRTAALLLLYREQPEVFSRSDACFKAQLVHALRRLAVLATRSCPRLDNAGKGDTRSWYNSPSIAARQHMQAWLLDALTPAALVLLKAAREAEALLAAEHTSARQLSEDVGTSFAAALSAVRKRIHRQREKLKEH